MDEQGGALRSKSIEQAAILIVDDMPENLKALREMLIPNGYRVRIAVSGELAIRHLQLSVLVDPGNFVGLCSGPDTAGWVELEAGRELRLLLLRPLPLQLPPDPLPVLQPLLVLQLAFRAK